MRGRCEGDFLDVLGCGGEQALAGNGGEAPETRVSVTVQLLGVGEGTFHRFFSALVNAFSPIGQAMGVGRFSLSAPGWVRRFDAAPIFQDVFSRLFFKYGTIGPTQLVGEWQPLNSLQLLRLTFIKISAEIDDRPS